MPFQDNSAKNSALPMSILETVLRSFSIRGDLPPAKSHADASSTASKTSIAVQLAGLSARDLERGPEPPVERETFLERALTDDGDLSERLASLFSGNSGKGGSTDFSVDRKAASIAQPDTVPGDTSSTVVIGANDSIVGELETTGDEDWYRLTVPEGITVAIDLVGSGTTPVGDTYLWVYDAGGTLLSEDDDSGAGSFARLSFTPPAAGDYFVAAGSFNGMGTGTYTLTTAAETVPGNTSTEVVVAVGDTLSGRIDSSGDADWYRVTLAEGQAITVDLAGTGADPLPDTVLTLYDDTGAPLTVNDNYLGPDTSQVTFIAPAAGDYFLGVSGYDGLATGDFSLSVSAGAAYTDAVPDTPGTTAAALRQGTVAGSFDYGTDHDWYRLEVLAGQTVDLSVIETGTTGAPVSLSLFGTDGTTLLATAAESGGTAATLQYTVRTEGTYYVDVGFDAAAPGDTTSYELTGDMPPLDLANTVETVLTLDTTDPIRVYILNAGETADGYTADAASAYEQSRIMAAFGTFTEVANIEFVQTTTRAEADIEVIIGDTPPYGYAYFPTYRNPSLMALSNRVAQWTDAGALDDGGFGYMIVIHEIGHLLGLDHTHDADEGSILMPGVTAAFGDLGDNDLNQEVFSIMSYNRGWQTGPLGPLSEAVIPYGTSQTPSPIDIAAVQRMYGANMTTNTGNDVYLLEDRDRGYVAIWDVSGIDEIRQVGTGASVIDLRAATMEFAVGGGGWVSHVPAFHGGLTIANGAIIENGRGSDGNDTITGNEAANRLLGGGGADSIAGGAGADTIVGGAGGDLLLGEEGDDLMLSDAAADLASLVQGGTPAYLIASELPMPTGAATIEWLFKSAGPWNGAAFQSLMSYAVPGQANEIIVGLGADGEIELFFKGAVNDTGIDGSVLFDGALHRVSLVIETAIESTFTLYVDGEALASTSFPAQSITSGGTLVFGQEQDSLGGSFDPAQAIDGAFGDIRIFDVVRSQDAIRAEAFASVVGPDDLAAMVALWQVDAATPGIATLAGGTSLSPVSVAYVDGGAEGDDTAFGGGGSDTILGDGGADILHGQAQDDVLRGSTGGDILFGGPGGDLLDGGAGIDRAQYYAFSTGLLADLQVPGNNTGAATGDTYVGIENLHGGNNADDLRGDTGDNVVWGVGGNDSVHGRLGDDSLFGGADDDILFGGPGGDLLNGGPGTDRAQYYAADTGLLADLQAAVNNTGTAAGDIFVSIENLHGGNSADDLRGDTGANVIWGAGGNDSLDGRDGADSLFSGDDDDILWGGAGPDVLNGGSGTDRAQYYATDTGLLADLQVPGNNTGAAAGDQYVSIENLHGGNNADDLRGNTGANVIWGAGGNDTVLGRDGADSLYGGSGGDLLDGGNDGDLLLGGPGDDLVRGRGGTDLLIGGTGRDVLTGGTEADVFVFYTLAESTPDANRDVITDFETGLDVINLAALVPGVLDFRGTAGFTATGTAELRLQETASGSTIVRVDVDGDGLQDMEINVAGITGLGAADFVL